MQSKHGLPAALVFLLDVHHVWHDCYLLSLNLNLGRLAGAELLFQPQCILLCTVITLHTSRMQMCTITFGYYMAQKAWQALSTGIATLRDFTSATYM